ncbi:MAG: hypothetical protein QW074_02745 [Candidatus Caldarchaeum sp.]|uniref:Lactate racemase C-terminal domain-containing protein n=1 Tax=Caldiarchaeum subterraneum TaxID=311458 RepID=A0A7J3WBY5_CALS0
MVELWLRYGRTMIFTDLEDNFEVLAPAKLWNNSEKLVENLMKHISSETRAIIIDYVHGLTGFDKVVETVFDAVRKSGVDLERLEVFVSGWRYCDESMEKVLVNMVKTIISEHGVGKISALPSNSLDEYSDVVVSPAVYWNGDVLTHEDFLETVGLRTFSCVVAPVVGRGGVVSEVYSGDEVSDTDLRNEAMKASAYIPSKEPQVVVVGGPGYPVDSRLQTCLNMASTVRELPENKVIVLALECSEGLGGKTFIDTLLNKMQPDNHYMAKDIESWRLVASRQKMCLVTALPSSIVSHLLAARQFDTLDQAMTYARRLKSREAHVLFVENGVGTRVLEYAAEGDEAEDKHGGNAD